MLQDHFRARLQAARRMGSIAIYASIGLTSAVSGAGVAMHLAAAPTTGENIQRSGGAATPAATAHRDNPAHVAAVPPSAAQAATAAGGGTASAPSAAKLTTWAPAAPSLAERQLTFAWGYAQRHPEARAGRAGPHVVANFGGARAQAPARVAAAPRGMFASPPLAKPRFSRWENRTMKAAAISGEAHANSEQLR